MYSGNASASIAGMNINAAPPPPSRALDDAQSSFDGLLKRLAELHTQIVNVADSTLGSVPQSGSVAAGQDTPPSGRVDGLRRSLSVAHDLMSSIEAQFSRFNAL